MGISENGSEGIFKGGNFVTVRMASIEVLKSATEANENTESNGKT